MAEQNVARAITAHRETLKALDARLDQPDATAQKDVLKVEIITFFKSIEQGLRVWDALWRAGLPKRKRSARLWRKSDSELQKRIAVRLKLKPAARPRKMRGCELKRMRASAPKPSCGNAPNSKHASAPK